MGRWDTHGLATVDRGKEKCVRVQGDLEPWSKNRPSKIVTTESMGKGLTNPPSA